ncbi:MAG: hypothetical protein HQ510_02730 [Candidatus Marinimicrobia bacterium]|nr:hypothetical protein [Candidatus Neomarinimicrobiota bacterium]
MTSRSENTYMMPANNYGKLAIVIALIGILLSTFGFVKDPGQFFHSYLVAYVFWVTISLGALFFLLMHHVTGAFWSVSLRHVVESIVATIPLMAILWIPIGFGIHDLYHWSHESVMASDKLLAAKAPYLNTTFFVIRTLIYFIIWGFISYKLRSLSKRTKSNNDILSMRKVSAVGTVFYALTVSFAMFDWLMSLDPHWYSTIYGVYLFGGAYLNGIAMVILVIAALKSLNLLTTEVTSEHYQDLGKLLFGFVVFWAYISASQYFLIWYGNIPEETIWFKRRWEGTWKAFSLSMIAVGFIVPFFALMFRAAKRNLVFLSSICLLLFVAHWMDMYWNVMPGFHRGNVSLSWIDLSTMVALGGLFFWTVWRSLASRSLIPLNDPYLNKSISHKNF